MKYIYLFNAISLIVFSMLIVFHKCPTQLPPTRLQIQKQWIDKHDPDWKIKNTLDSKMLDICSAECDEDYCDTMETGEPK